MYATSPDTGDARLARASPPDDPSCFMESSYLYSGAQNAEGQPGGMMLHDVHLMACSTCGQPRGRASLFALGR